MCACLCTSHVNEMLNELCQLIIKVEVFKGLHHSNQDDQICRINSLKKAAKSAYFLCRKFLIEDQTLLKGRIKTN